MKSEELFAAIGEVDDKLLLRKKTKKNKKRFMTICMTSAACLVLLIGVLAIVNQTGGFHNVPIGESGTEGNSASEGNSVPSIGGDGGCGEQGSEGIGHMEYADLNEAGIAPMSAENTNDGINMGPLMPMTFTIENVNITADRTMNYDFTNRPANGIAKISDTYVLTNTSDKDQVVTYLYPYTGYRSDFINHKPLVSVNGKSREFDVLNGVYAGYNQYGFYTFYSLLCGTDDYATLLKNDVAGSVPVYAEDILNTNVAVFEYEYPAQVSEEYDLCVIRMNAEKASDVYYVNMPVYYEDGEYIYVGFDANEKSSVKLPTLVCLGGKPAGYEVLSGKFDEAWNLVCSDSVSLEVEEYESTLKDYMIGLADGVAADSEYKNNAEFMNLYYNKILQITSDLVANKKDGAETDEDGIASYYGEDLYHIVTSEWDSFGLYLLSDTITIPAGETITVAFEYDRIGKYWEEPLPEYKGIFGYDNLINMGTNIIFTAQQATIEENGKIEIVEQNYGFDLENNIRSVDLELDAERYYMYVKFTE